METRLDRLLELVEGHIACYEELVEVLKQEQKALLSMDLQQVQENSKAKEAIVRKLKLGVTPLSETILQTARDLGLPVDPQPALIELAGAAVSPWSEKLSRVALTLTRIKRTVASQNEANKAFVKESLNMIGGTISLLTGAPKPEKSGYLASGQRAQAYAARPVRLSREI